MVYFPCNKKSPVSGEAELFLFENLCWRLTPLAAFRADGKFFHGCAGFFAYIFQLINRGKILPAPDAGLHFESASPDFALVAG
jgi:hypothetical protein